jgi:hypothetical protein
LSPVAPDLAAALQADDDAEDSGMHPDHRVTCWTCQDWASPEHAQPFVG